MPVSAPYLILLFLLLSLSNPFSTKEPEEFKKKKRKAIKSLSCYTHLVASHCSWLWRQGSTHTVLCSPLQSHLLSSYLTTFPPYQLSLCSWNNSSQDSFFWSNGWYKCQKEKILRAESHINIYELFLWASWLTCVSVFFSKKWDNKSRYLSFSC